MTILSVDRDCDQSDRRNKEKRLIQKHTCISYDNIIIYVIVMLLLCILSGSKEQNVLKNDCNITCVTVGLVDWCCVGLMDMVDGSGVMLGGIVCVALTHWLVDGVAGQSQMEKTGGNTSWELSKDKELPRKNKTWIEMQADQADQMVQVLSMFCQCSGDDGLTDGGGKCCSEIVCCPADVGEKWWGVGHFPILVWHRVVAMPISNIHTFYETVSNS